MRNFTIPVLSKIETTSDCNGPQGQFYHSNTDKFIECESFSNFAELFLQSLLTNCTTNKNAFQ